MRPEFFFADFFRDSKADDIQKYRNEAIKKITQKLWPKHKQGDFWAYTSPSELFEGLMTNKDDKDEVLIDIDNYLIEDALNILDTEDGFLIRDAIPKGVEIYPISEYLKENAELHNANNKEIENFILLNKAFLNSGFYLKISDNTSIDIPIQIIYTKADKHVFRKNVIKTGKFSKLTLIETYVSENKNRLFFNTDTLIEIDESSRLEHYKFEFSNNFDSVFSNLSANLKRDSYYQNFYYTNGGNKIKNNIKINLSDKGAQSVLNGLYILSDKKHIDNTTVINHVKENTKSTQLYKGVLNDESKSVFDGLIEIFPKAKLSNSNQLNQNLLLSRDAQSNSKPQLIIGNDDVKCTHGSTTGQIDENQLFYLQSRGLSENIGKKLLSKAFINEIIYQIENKDIKDFLINYIDNTFKGE